jgi:hypothetical protein
LSHALCTPDWPSHPEIERREPRNLLLLAVHQIVLRTGWIFKTESVIMPAFLDAVSGGAGWVRGCLPVLNRLGQGVPPLFAANALKAMRLKKRALVVLTGLMSLPFLALSLTWLGVGGQNRAWIPGLFLTLYFAFFVLYGLYLVTFGTVQGKLIRPTQRGRLIVLSTFWGAIPATLVALSLMPCWLDSDVKSGSPTITIRGGVATLSQPQSARVQRGFSIEFDAPGPSETNGAAPSDPLERTGAARDRMNGVTTNGPLQTVWISRVHSATSFDVVTPTGDTPSDVETARPVRSIHRPARWEQMFIFVAGCFFLSGLVALLLFEPGGGALEKGTGPASAKHGAATEGWPGRAGKSDLSTSARQPGCLGQTLRVLREDANLRRLVLVAMLVGCGLILFPHYQALARTKLGLSGVQLMVWVVTQNVAVATFSLFVGPLADRRGYRITLRLLIFASAAPPAFAISLLHLPEGVGAELFWLVYVPLGVTPLVPRALLNYALEICTSESHPRYQSIVSLGVAAPFILSPAVGWLVDAVGFGWVFGSMIVLVILSGLLTFGLDEPRHRLGDEAAEATGAETFE